MPLNLRQTLLGFELQHSSAFSSLLKNNSKKMRKPFAILTDERITKLHTSWLVGIQANRIY